MDLKEEEILGSHIDSHWYYRAKARALEEMLPPDFNRVLMDVGAGSGYFSRHLVRRGLVDKALCVDIGYPRDRVETLGGGTIAYRKAPEKSEAGAALFMDVLEHVEDDAGLLASYKDYLPATTTAIITVPAFRFLWSGHDVFLEHYRRYTVASLEKTIRRAGWEPVNVHYFYGLVFPAALAMRLLSPSRHEVRSSLTVHGAAVNTILHAACRLEVPFMKWNRLAGLSVCATCKPA